MFSFGVNERLNQEANQLNGYSVPVCLWGKDEEPTTEESMFYKGMKKLFNICRQYLEEEYGADTASHLSDIFYYKQTEYVDKKGKTQKKKDDKAAPVLYVKRIYSDKTKKIMSLLYTKGVKNVNPFDYLNQYYKVKMALIIEGIYLSKNVISIQVKANEVYVKPLKPRQSFLKINESDNESDDQSDTEIVDQSEVVNIEDLIISDNEVDE